MYNALIEKQRNLDDLYVLSFIYKALNNIEEDNKTRIENQIKILALREEVFRVENQVKILALREEVFEEVQTYKIKQALAKAHGGMAWYLLFDKSFKKAQEHAHKGLEIDPSQEWINTNLALAYLFTGQYDKAQAIYMAFKDKPLNENSSFRDTFLKDFKELEEAGITHPDVEKIRQLLSQ